MNKIIFTINAELNCYSMLENDKQDISNSAISSMHFDDGSILMSEHYRDNDLVKDGTISRSKVIEGNFDTCWNIFKFEIISEFDGTQRDYQVDMVDSDVIFESEHNNEEIIEILNKPCTMITVCLLQDAGDRVICNDLSSTELSNCEVKDVKIRQWVKLMEMSIKAEWVKQNWIQ